MSERHNADDVAPYYEGQGVVLYHGDCRSILPRLTGDVLVTDPPFNVGKDYGASQDDLSVDEYADLMRAVAACGIERQAWVTPSNRLALFVSLLGTEARMVIVRRGAKGPKRWGWFDQFDLLLVRGKPTRYESNLWDDVRLKGEGYYFREHTWDHPGYTPYPMIARLVGSAGEPWRDSRRTLRRDRHNARSGPCGGLQSHRHRARGTLVRDRRSSARSRRSRLRGGIVIAHNVPASGGTNRRHNDGQDA